MKILNRFSLVLVFALAMFACQGPSSDVKTPDINQDSLYVRQHYVKHEYRVPMRDGVKLFTSVYAPKDTTKSYPVLMMRTPYSVSPYGEEAYRKTLGPSMELARDGYIFVYQDVRGKFMSEGTFTWMAPNKEDPQAWDESRDTYDTIDWLLNNVAHNNGKVGMWGASYPGFYVVAGMMDAHPALKAVMPSAPMADLWKGDDVTHNGAFLMPHNLNFLSVFGAPRPEPTTQWPKPMMTYETPDGYAFWKGLGPLPNVDKEYFHGKNRFWNEYREHPVYDEFWKSRNVLPHLHDVKAAVLTIGGWFDAQDLYGPLHVYQSVENKNPGAYNGLVMGPWYHGRWLRGDGDHSAGIQWGSKTAVYYREHIEEPFFNHFLKGEPLPDLPEAMAFNTGNRQWTRFDAWPPAQAKPRNIYLRENGKLSFEKPGGSGRGYDEYVSDPEHPVPFTAQITPGYGNDWMVEDQRFAWRRPDVLSYEVGPLNEDLTVAGPIQVHLTASTSGTDSDFIVKVIDVWPDDAQNPDPNPYGVQMGGCQMLLRGDPIRAKFRNSLTKPEPMTPNKPTELSFEMRDVYHTFRKGHKIMIQVQSSWFPMIDLNPHKFVDLFNDVKESDYRKATQRIYRSADKPSYVTFGVME